MVLDKFQTHFDWEGIQKIETVLTAHFSTTVRHELVWREFESDNPRIDLYSKIISLY